MTLLHGLLTPGSLPHLTPADPLLTALVDKTVRPRLYLAALLSPYKGIQSLGKGKSKPAIELVIREALKLGVQNHYVDGIPELFASAELASGLSMNKFSSKRRRVEMGTYSFDDCIIYVTI